VRRKLGKEKVVVAVGRVGLGGIEGWVPQYCSYGIERDSLDPVGRNKKIVDFFYFLRRFFPHDLMFVL